MSLHVEEWALMWLFCGLLVAGVGLAVSAIRRPRPDSRRSSMTGVILVCISSGAMLCNLPRLLGWPYDVVMTLDTVAFLPIAAALVIGVRGVMRLGAVRSKEGRG